MLSAHKYIGPVECGASCGLQAMLSYNRSIKKDQITFNADCATILVNLQGIQFFSEKIRIARKSLPVTDFARVPCTTLGRRSGRFIGFLKIYAYTVSRLKVKITYGNYNVDSSNRCGFYGDIAGMSQETLYRI